MMKEEKLISTIIPVYNAEKTLSRAVESILCQMDGIVELILVDDGSTDQSGTICEDYMAKYADIHVIHKANGGTSSAKNMGILAAKGQYISFMDSDDYLEPTAYTEIQEIIDMAAPDCIDFGWRYISKGEVREPVFHKLPKNTVLDEVQMREIILPPLLNLRNDPDHFIFDFCCNKVFRASIIHNNNIFFDEDKRVWEDRTFLLRCIRYSKTYYAMDRCFYNYVDVPSSLSRRYNLDFFHIILANFRHYSELFDQEFDFNSQYANDYWCHAIENMIFRSLEQTENTVQIRQNILGTLANTQVVHWYANRKPQTAFEQRVKVLVASGQGEEALKEYEKRQKRKKNLHCLQSMLGEVKQRIRTVVSIIRN